MPCPANGQHKAPANARALSVIHLYCASTSDARDVSSSFTLSGERIVTSAPKFIIHVRNTGLTNTFTRMSKCVSVIFENAVSKPNLSIMTLASLF